MDASALRKLPRDRRVKQGRDFARAKVGGKRVVQGCLILNWVNLPPGSTSRVGVITSRRVGEAVARSRARRLLREAFRLSQPVLGAAVDAILIARPSIVGKKLAQVSSDYLCALRKARLYQEPPAASPAESGASPAS